MTEYLEPLEIELKRNDGYMLIKWNDGHAGRNTFVTMRWNCPCAGCRGEMGSKGRLDFIKLLTLEEVTLASLEAVGLYALRPNWKDGHETGLYTYEHLRDLCECDECKAKFPDRFENFRLTEKFQADKRRSGRS